MERVTAAALSVNPISGWFSVVWHALRSLAAIVIFLAVSANVWSAEGAGTVKTLIGSATITRGDAVLPVAEGQRVFPGDRVTSGPDSYVGIMLRDDTRLTIGPRSELLIREFEFNPTSHAGSLAVSFLKGTARVVTGLMARQSRDRMRFDTPTTTIGIRGTEFVVDLEPEQS